MQKDTLNRHIRIFLSSTFRDMQSERDYLIKNTFPELRRRCRSRGLELTEVDLRWGVTREQAENGEVLPICLKEIERSRPYFIGLLGERYGWIPPKEQIHPGLLDKEQWIIPHLDKSVTEMEILHGVLNNPEMTEKAFFYFRDPSVLNQLSPEQLEIYRESNPDLQSKLEALKDRIRKSGFSVEENYTSPENLGKAILKDLWEVIQKDFPAEDINPLDQEAMEHERFAASRRKAYIGREENYRKLTLHAEKDNPPLLICGGSGSGKTSLIANWAGIYRKDHPEVFLLEHYIGSSAKRTDYLSILKRIMLEIKRRYDFENEVPQDDTGLKNAFPNWLHMAGAKGRMILILDGLNQLEDKDDAHELYWLPEYIPEGISVFVTTVPGPMTETLKKRNWPVFQVEALNREERKALIEQHLEQYTKKLENQHVDRINDTEQTGNPLYLKVLLNELRVFGVYEKLGEQIDHYLRAKDPESLYNLVLERLEKDYEGTVPGLVGQTMSLLYASRNGLTENEILDLLGKDQQPLARALWSPLFLAIEDATVNRNGLLGFFHDYLRKAVYARYIREAQNEQKLHFKLAQYFFQQENNSRKYEELPWQCLKGQTWSALHQVLSDPVFTIQLFQANGTEVYYYWSQLEAHSEFRLAKTYEEVFKEPLNYLDQLFGLSLLFRHFSHFEKAYELNYNEYKYHFERKDLEALREVMPISLALLTQLRQPELAERFGKQYLDICVATKNRKAEATALDFMATSSMQYGEHDQALDFYQKSLKISEELNDELSIALTCLNMSNIYDKKKNYETAHKLLDRTEDIAKKLNNIAVLITCYNNRGLFYTRMGQPEKAIEKHLSDARLSAKYGDKAGLTQCYNNLSFAYGEMGNYKEAGQYKHLQVKLLSETGHMDDLYDAIHEMGQILVMQGENASAVKIINQAADYYRNTKQDKKLVQCLQDVFSILKDGDNHRISDKTLDEFITLSAQLDDKERLIKGLSSKLSQLLGRGRYSELIPYFEKIEEIYSELDRNEEREEIRVHKGTLAETIHKQREELKQLQTREPGLAETGDSKALMANLYRQAELLGYEEYPAAARIWERYEQQALEQKNIENYYQALTKHLELARKRDADEDALKLYNKQLEVLEYVKANDQALSVYRQQEMFLQMLGDMKNLHFNLHKQSLLLKTMEKYQEALQIHHREEQLCIELKHTEGLCISLLNQNSVLQRMNQHQQALEKLNQLETVCIENRLPDMLQSCYKEKINILQALEEHEALLGLADNYIELCQALNNPAEELRITGMKANLLNQSGKGEEALTFHYREIELAENMKDPQGVANAFINISGTLMGLGRNAEVLEFLNKLEQVATENKLEVPDIVYEVKKNLEEMG